MNDFDHMSALLALNESIFGHLGPFEFLYDKNGNSRSDTRHGTPCYVFTSSQEYFYVLLDGTVLKGQDGLNSIKQV